MIIPAPPHSCLTTDLHHLYFFYFRALGVLEPLLERVPTTSGLQPPPPAITNPGTGAPAVPLTIISGIFFHAGDELLFLELFCHLPLGGPLGGGLLELLLELPSEFVFEALLTRPEFDPVGV